MNHIILRFLFFIGLFIGMGVNSIYAAIDFTVSPLVYELKANPGDTLTKTASIRNNGSTPVTLYTAKSDFVASGTGGQPKFVRKSELVNPDQEISTWISISANSVTVNPQEEKAVDFTITIPTNATPGGHYGAVFFKNNNSETTGNAVGINVDYGVLVILEVAGDIVVDGGVSGVNIHVSSDGGGWANPQFDPTLKERIKSFITTELFSPGTNGNTPTPPPACSGAGCSTPPPAKDPINVSIEVEFENKGNTHIRPSGEIEITDEDGNIYKNIGKKSIVNEEGSIVGEEIVDYIPVNDEEGNVLPKTKRTFESEWKGFPYQDFNENGEKVIKYKDLGEYYTEKNLGKNKVIMFWEKIKTRTGEKKLTANIKISYKGEDGENVEYNSAKEFSVPYTEQYVGYNWRVVCIAALISFFICFWFLIAWKRRKKKEEKIEKKIREKIEKEEYKKKK